MARAPSRSTAQPAMVRVRSKAATRIKASSYRSRESTGRSMTGVLLSHGCFAGSIGSFDHLRLLLAQTAGYTILDYRASGGPIMPNLDFWSYCEDDLLGEWPNGAPDDPLIILLVHDEHDGRIKWQHCPLLADRLDELGEVLMKKGGDAVLILQ